MRTCVQWVVLGRLVIACSGPATAQPLEDSSSLPARAYDSVASLAADGLIQGYPDGTDPRRRCAHRNELAAALARVTANVEPMERRTWARERLQAGPARNPPSAEQFRVTQAGIGAILRLADELRSSV